MGYVLEQRSNSIQQHTSDTMKEKILSPWANKSPQYQDKLKVRQRLDQPYLGPSRESRQRGSTKHVNQFRSSENHQMTQRKTCKDDELVKHMSNLPGFLQQVEREKNVQAKALNFGVLDWKRLEKWKYNERMPAKGHRRTLSSASSSLYMTSGSPKVSSQLKKPPPSRVLHPLSSLQGKQPSSHGLHCDSSPLRKHFRTLSSHLYSLQVERKTEGVGQPKGQGTCVHDFRASQSSSSDRQQGNFNQKARPCVRGYSEINMNHGKRNDTVKKTELEKEALAVDRDKNGSSNSSTKTINAQAGKSKTRSEGAVDLTPENCTVEKQNIVLLVPKYFPKNSCSETSHFTEFNTRFDGQLAEAHQKRFSDCFSSQELRSGEFSSGIPHSCPMSTSNTDHIHSGIKPPNSVDAEVMESGFCVTAYPNDIFVPPKQCEAKHSCSVDTSNSMGIDVAEPKAGKGRHPSPNRRFSFSLGKMGRSLSFKESSAVPQLSSTYIAAKSGPVGSEFSSGMESYDRDKAAANSSRGRSSPLRRLLDPLLKYKGAHSAEIVPSPVGNSRVMPSKLMNTNAVIQDRKHEVSTFQALLQLSMKNGLPLFKIAADNNSSMLAASVKKLPSSGKGDCSIIYAFYSVHEIRKKSVSWISQGLKGKSCGLGYNIVGQMKISSNYLPQNAKDLCIVRECVLFGIDLGQVDKEMPELLPKREIAAIVVKNPSEESNEEKLSDKGRSCKEKESAWCVSGNSNSTVVILPGGIHGLPNKGSPSPLINRWKSSGSCDCGGWDMGCKLRILANQDGSSKIMGQSTHSAAADNVNLFVQGGEQRSKPIFSLEPTSNGLYSVQFNASISLLEAFSICVAVITCRKFTEILDMNNLTEAGHFPEGMFGTDKMKTKTTSQVPIRYVTCPPTSPAGRI